MITELDCVRQAPAEDLTPAPGTVVIVRDEEWLITNVERASDGWFLSVKGLSELVRDTEAVFSTALDEVQAQDPAAAQVVIDDSPGYRRSRLWLEATVRKTAVPIADPALTVGPQGLLDPLAYQLSAVQKALDPDNLRPRILLADAVGLGKTLEIGMILAELVRRGRGERMLVVTPRHVLEQMQFELWTRFALPFVRLDSLGIQRIRQKLPANRNPFAYFKRVIISIDTLKSDRYLAHLQKQRWDAVVIDESHNVTNAMTQNNRLARLLSSRADALILASATPHNGKLESFAELVRMLEPSAVTPKGELNEDQVRRLVIRRHRHSPEVAEVVGDRWAERLDPVHKLVPATALENQIARMLEHVWLYPESGSSPSADRSRLFPWTLAKSFLSSPAALQETAHERIRRLGAQPGRDAEPEVGALRELEQLASASAHDGSGKYTALLAYLREIGVAERHPTRAVIFAERIPTLTWLRRRLLTDLGLREDEVVLLHGGLSDEDQQGIVESFKQETSPIRVLVTGDVASEGVNLHLQCHHLVHFDIPWSLIRIEQRNGRIDRYGQRHRPQITTLLLDTDSPRFSGDIRVLQRLVEKEHEAHRALGDAASLMGKHDVAAEEAEIRLVLAGERQLDDVVPDVADRSATDDPLWDILFGSQATAAPQREITSEAGLYATDLDYLRDVLEEVLQTPGMAWPSGVSWREHRQHAIAELVPTPDLRQRLEALPQSYLRDRHVAEHLKLATTPAAGREALEAALADDTMSSWPEAHYLSPLHPLLDWASDHALAYLGRNQIFAVVGGPPDPAVLLLGTLTNARGQVVASSFLVAAFPNPDSDFVITEAFGTLPAALGRLGFSGAAVNRGVRPDLARYAGLVPTAVRSAREVLQTVTVSAEQDARTRVARWTDRAARWDDDAEALVQRRDVRDRRTQVDLERQLAQSAMPDAQLVRPLLLVLPDDGADVAPRGSEH